MRFLRKNTAVIISVGPFLDKTDGVTLETALTITNERITLVAETDDGSAPTLVLDNIAGATSGTANDLNYITGQDNGMMQMELASADTNRLGRMMLTITDAANHVPVFHEFMIVNSALYDAFFATSGGAVPNVAAGGSGGLLVSGSNTGTTTLGALTVTGTTTISDGLVVSRSTSNASAITATGNGTGSGIVATSGSGATGDGIQATSVATNGNGLACTGVGTGNGVKAASASGAAISAVASTSGDGITATGAGTTKHGINATGGATSSDGIRATGGGTGAGLNCQSGAGATGNGITAKANSTNGHGIQSDGVGTGDGMQLTKGASGADLDADIQGTLDTVTTAANVTTINGLAANVITAASMAADASAEIADAVWDEAQSGHVTAGTFGRYLDAQVANVETDTQDIQSRLPAALVSGRIDASVGAMATDVITSTALAASAVSEIQTGLSTLDAAGVRSAVGMASANLDTQLDAVPTANENADALLDRANGIETGLTPRNGLRLIAASTAGKASGGGTTTMIFRNAVADNKDRITATVDSNGNRSAITTDLT